MDTTVRVIATLACLLMFQCSTDASRECWYNSDVRSAAICGTVALLGCFAAIGLWVF